MRLHLQFQRRLYRFRCELHDSTLSANLDRLPGPSGAEPRQSAFPAGKEEFFHVISGRLRMTSLAGEAREFGPGDACVIPAGFEGVFEVLEPVRKHFVVIDRNAS